MKIYIPVKPNIAQNTHLKVSVTYTKGGMSFLSGNVSKRGIFAHVVPVKRSEGAVSFMRSDGNKMILEELGRANAKKLAKWEDEAESQINAKSGKIWDLVEYVATKGGYVYADSNEVQAAA